MQGMECIFSPSFNPAIYREILHFRCLIFRNLPLNSRLPQLFLILAFPRRPCEIFALFRSPFVSAVHHPKPKSKGIAGKEVHSDLAGFHKSAKNSTKVVGTQPTNAVIAQVVV